MDGDVAKKVCGAFIGRRRYGPLAWSVAILHLSLILLITLQFPLSTMAQKTPTPIAGFHTSNQANSFSGDLSTVYSGIDVFWAEIFGAVGQPYVSPGLAPTTDPIPMQCSGTDAFYCPENLTMYLDPRFVQEILATYGDFAPIVVLAHEWGHHLQTLTNVPYLDSSAELQADCLAGVYAREAQRTNLLDSGDITEAVTISGDSGDSPLRPQDIRGAHGTNDQRITSFMTGYITGLAGCNLPGFSAPTAPPPTPDAPNSPSATVPTQVAVSLSANDLINLLPGALPLSHSQCFRIEDTLNLSFDDVVARLEGTDEARSLLNAWGWQASVNRTFGCDTPPDGDAGYVDMSLHLFGSPQAAQEAVDYFAMLRARGTLLIGADPPAMGDHAAVLTGPASNGKEFTLYVNSGPLLVRVTAISPSGIPFGNVLTITSSLLASLPSLIGVPQPSIPPLQPTVVIAPQATAPVTTLVPDAGTSAGLLPVSLPVTNSDCFEAQQVFVYTFPTLVERFPGVPDAAAKLQRLGWQEGAYNEYACAAALPGQLNWAYISVHRFPDANLASAAAVFFASSRALATQLQPDTAAALGDGSLAIAGPSETGEEYSLFVTQGPYLLRVTGVAESGDPRPDVERIMMAILADVMIQAPPTSTTSSPLPTVTAVPTVVPPTPTLVPTSTPPPTATPLPTATLTPTPLPTATPLPTPTLTADSVLEPTPTPRVIVVETPTPSASAQAPTPIVGTGVASGHRDWVNEELLAYGERLDERYLDDEPAASDSRDVEFDASYMLAVIGTIGPDRGADIYSGARTADEALAEADQAVAIFEQPGLQVVDIAWIYRQTFARLLVTDLSNLTPQQQVAVTNAALGTVEIGMASDAIANFMRVLDQHGQEFLSARARGETDRTYPEFLDELGLANALG